MIRRLLNIIRAQNNDRLYRKNLHVEGSLLNKFYKTKTIFIHIPKTAGTSLVRSIYSKPPEGHRTAAFLRSIFKDRFTEYFKFCFVRNPYDRLYSSYKFLERGGVNIHDANAFQKHLIRYKDFEDFVLHGLSYNLLDEIIHFTPQTIFICDQKDVILVDFIGRFENLEEDFMKLADKLSLDIALPHLNSTNKISYRDIYTNEMMIKVKEIYKRDFDILGY